MLGFDIWQRSTLTFTLEGNIAIFEFVGRNTAKRRKTTANESVNFDYILFAKTKLYLLCFGKK